MQIRPMSSGVVESIAQRGVTVKDIPGYIPPIQPSAQPWRLTKNQKYQLNMSTLPQGMICTTYIMSALMQMKYEDHEFLAWEDVAKDPFVSMVAVEGGLIVHIL